MPTGSAPAPPGTPAGWVAGRFELLRVLGRGSSATVHGAHDHRAGRLVALKLLHARTTRATADSDGPDEAQARFAAGAALARQLDHPDIVRIFDVGVHEGRPWLAMEAAPGTDLGRYTQPQRLLPEPLVLELGERLALVLAHAHARGVVHRDLKPSNVLVHWPSGSLKVVDFGLARGQDAEATRTGLLVGTPGYMAPEQLAGAPPDARSDLYALGALLFELFSGRLPFEGSSLGELLRRVAQDEAPDLRTLRPQLPQPLAEAVAALLRRDPEARTGDAALLATRWQALRQGWAGGVKSR